MIRRGLYCAAIGFFIPLMLGMSMSWAFIITMVLALVGAIE